MRERDDDKVYGCPSCCECKQLKYWRKAKGLTDTYRCPKCGKKFTFAELEKEERTHRAWEEMGGRMWGDK